MVCCKTLCTYFVTYYVCLIFMLEMKMKENANIELDVVFNDIMNNWNESNILA